MGVKTRKKLIEVALPLDAINKASVRENYIYRGNPSSIHKWWAQRPLAAARAVIFSQMVDDPSEYVDTLKMDDKLRRRADNELKKRLKVWTETVAIKDKADAVGVDSPDPGPEPTLDEILAEQERDRLFKIIEELVVWENTTNEVVLEKARAEIWQSWRRTCSDNANHPQAKALFDRNKLPTFHDPFAGGGTLPLEAQRLDFEVYASDLNPVAVLINKALIEIPPKFAGMPPINPEWQSKPVAEKAMRVWRGAEGLAEDVRYFGKLVREAAEKRIGHVYPNAEVTQEMAQDRSELIPYVGTRLPVISFLWARTVKSPNPAYRLVDVPLASTFVLSSRVGRPVYAEPVVENGEYHFALRSGRKPTQEAVSGTKLSRGANFFCLMSGTPITSEYIKAEGVAGRMGARMIASVVEGSRGRLYLPPTPEMEKLANSVQSRWEPEQELVGKSADQLPLYGIRSFSQLFTQRQLYSLTTLYDLVKEVRADVNLAARMAGGLKMGERLEAGGNGIEAYADSIVLLLSFAVDKTSEYCCTSVPWYSKEDRPKGLFARQAIPMVWDYAEINPLSTIGGCFEPSANLVAGALLATPLSGRKGHVAQANAIDAPGAEGSVVSTDPPYYDNVFYADLSDFFYSWLRFPLRELFPSLFSTLAVPKSEELVASADRNGGKTAAEQFFLNGMTQAMKSLSSKVHPEFPVTIYYAFRQSESRESSITRTGWETFLDAVINAGFSLTGTWPMHTERGGRAIGVGSNALASSIVLVCRKRPGGTTPVTRREFVNALKFELPKALRYMQRCNIAPVDLAQAAIGPGMAVFTRYAKVLDAEGNKLTVREALTLINETLDEVLAEQEGDFDADTRWALTWFEENGFDSGEFGRAEQLSKAKNTSISEMADPRTSPILEAKAGKVRLFRPEELEEDWTPESDGRLTVWDMVHQLIRVLEKDGETAAAGIVRQLGAQAETARELCYRLYTVCERKSRNSEARSYNGLVQSWPEIVRLAAEQATSTGGEKQILPGM